MFAFTASINLRNEIMSNWREEQEAVFHVYIVNVLKQSKKPCVNSLPSWMWKEVKEELVTL